MKKDNFTQMTTAPIPGLIGKLAVPTIISMLVTSFYNIADTYFVGKINTQSTAAVGIVFSVMSIIQAVGFFFGHGSGNYISRKLGAQETDNAEKMAATGFFFALFMGVVIAVVGLLLLTPLSVALGSTPTILPYTEKYLGIILIGAPFMTASLVLNNGGYRHRCGSEHRVGSVTDFHFRNGDIGSGISYHHQPDVQFLTTTVYGTPGK